MPTAVIQPGEEEEEEGVEEEEEGGGGGGGGGFTHQIDATRIHREISTWILRRASVRSILALNNTEPNKHHEQQQQTQCVRSSRLEIYICKSEEACCAVGFRCSR
jgi:hypothetical protein